jgi:hypothetical protein
MVFLTCSLTLAAQSAPKVEIFGGFSYLNYETTSVNLPSGTETMDTSCPDNTTSSSSTCVTTTTVVGSTLVNFNPRMGLYGWNGSVTAVLTPWFGFTTDVSGNYSTASRSATSTQTIIQNQTCAPNTCSSTSTLTSTYQYTVSEPLLHHFLFGPQFYFPTGRMRSYAHFLIGGDHKNVTSSEIVTPNNSIGAISGLATSGVPTNFFAMGIGGGADYPIRKNLFWRTGVDYLTSTGTAQNHFRVSTGLVWRIGK